MSEEHFRAVTAAGLLPSESQFHALLQSVVDVARAIFHAQAASVFLHDEETDELVFEAVSGQGQRELIGMRMPPGTGIAGFVLVTRELLVIDDLGGDPRFARDAAESTGYVPKAIAAVPLLAGERVLGVLSVLDRAPEAPFGAAESNLLSLFAHQAALALDLLMAGRRARRLVEGADDRTAVVARLAALLDGAEDDRGAYRLLDSLEKVLRSSLR